MKQAYSILTILSVLLTCCFATADDGKLYIASKVYTMEGAPLTPGQVLVVDGKIKAVAEKVATDGVSPEIIDLGENSVLIPGLVDAYSQTPIANGASDEMTKEVTPNFAVHHGIDWHKKQLRHQLLAGTTTMCVCPGTQNVIGGTAAIIKTKHSENAILTDNGPLLATVSSDPSGGNFPRTRPDSIYVRQPTNRMGVIWILRKTMHAAKDSSPIELKKVEEVLNKKRALMMVSRNANDIQTVATLAEEFGFAPIIVGGQEAYKVKDLLVAEKYPVILQAFATGSRRGAEATEISWNQAGILAESDIVFALSGNNLLTQAQFAHRYGLDAEKAMRAITKTPAEILKIDDQVGSIAPGKHADLVALTGEPLEITSQISWVMVNGNIIEMNKE